MTDPTIWQACGASGGSNGMDARGTNADSVRDCRMAADERPTIRIRSRVGVTGGYVVGATTNVAPVRKRKPRRAAWRPVKSDPTYGVWAR